LCADKGCSNLKDSNRHGSVEQSCGRGMFPIGRKHHEAGRDRKYKTFVPRGLIQNEYRTSCFGFNLILGFSLKLAAFNDIKSPFMFPEKFLHEFPKNFLTKIIF